MRKANARSIRGASSSTTVGRTDPRHTPSPLPSSFSCSVLPLCCSSAEYRVQAGELEYWLVSPSERLVRVELVHPANRERHVLLQQLCTDLVAPMELCSTNGESGAAVEQCVDHWPEMRSGLLQHGGLLLSDVAAASVQPCADNTRSLPMQQQHKDSSTTRPPVSVVPSETVPPWQVRAEAETAQATPATAVSSARQLSSLSAIAHSSDSALSFLPRSVTEPVTRVAAARDQCSPLLCPSTPPLPQPSPFVLSTDEAQHATDGAHAAAARDFEHTSSQPARTCALYGDNALTCTKPTSHPSPLLFPRRISQRAAEEARTTHMAGSTQKGGSTQHVCASAVADSRRLQVEAEVRVEAEARLSLLAASCTHSVESSLLL